MLALDVLSGLPTLKQCPEENTDFYEVWGFREDASSLILLRYFDSGEALGLACFAGPKLWQDNRLMATLSALLQTFEAPAAAQQDLTQGFAPLERLAGLNRLCLALAESLTAQDRSIGGLQVLGDPSDATLRYLRFLRNVVALEAR
jgi:hypothetical protein